MPCQSFGMRYLHGHLDKKAYSGSGWSDCSADPIVPLMMTKAGHTRLTFSLSIHRSIYRLGCNQPAGFYQRLSLTGTLDASNNRCLLKSTPPPPTAFRRQ